MNYQFVQILIELVQLKVHSKEIYVKQEILKTYIQLNLLPFSRQSFLDFFS